MNFVQLRDGNGQAPNLRRCEYCARTFHLHDTCDGCGAPVPVDWPGFVWDYKIEPPPKPPMPENRIVPEGGDLVWVPWWWWTVPVAIAATLAKMYWS